MPSLSDLIFVFGSNLAGRHGAGAALHALRHFGAQRGIGRGRTGNAYALPTKGHDLKPLAATDIEKHIFEFADYARQHPELIFLFTPVGTGFAGFSIKLIIEIASRAKLPPNVVLANTWLK